MIAYAAIGLTAVLAVLALIWKLESFGRRDAEADRMRKILDDIQKVEKARDDVHRSSDLARRVRARFTRRVL